MAPTSLKREHQERFTIGGYTKEVVRIDSRNPSEHSCPNIEELVLDQIMFDQGRFFHFFENVRSFKNLKVYRSLVFLRMLDQCVHPVACCDTSETRKYTQQLEEFDPPLDFE